MNNELRRRLEAINAGEVERNTAFERWVRMPEFEYGDKYRRTAELIERVKELHQELADLEERIARSEVG